jgi:hypothetical protein
MICVIIRNLHSDGGDSEAHAIGQHPMNDDGDFARQRHLGLLQLQLGVFEVPGSN